VTSRLNLGSGEHRFPEFLNVDIHGGDLRAAAERLPFKEGSFEFVHASHVLEHVVDLDRVMREIHRILSPGGILQARVPYGLRSLYVPFHLHAFNLRTFDYFTQQPSGLQGGALFNLLEKRISDWWLPYRWHLERYFPRLFRYVSASEDDGKRHLLVPTGIRQELFVRLEKPKR